MKKLIKMLSPVALLLYILLVLNPECGVSPPSPPSPVGGKWKFAFTCSNGSSFGNCFVNIGGSGSFCGKIKLADTGEEFYVTGYCEGGYDSKLSGRFADTCNSNNYPGSTISGSIKDLTGAGYGSGSFSFTQKNPSYKGTWQAKRNL